MGGGLPDGLENLINGHVVQSVGALHTLPRRFVSRSD
jgi:hypothetical protein